MLGALVGVGGARDKEVVEVVMNMLDTPLTCKPLYCFRQAVKNERCRAQAEGEDPIKVELSLPVHAQEVVVAGSDRAEAKGTLNVELGHGGMAAKLHDRVHGIVHCGVPQREVGDAYAIVDASAGGGATGA